MYHAEGCDLHRGHADWADGELEFRLHSCGFRYLVRLVSDAGCRWRISTLHVAYREKLVDTDLRIRSPLHDLFREHRHIRTRAPLGRHSRRSLGARAHGHVVGQNIPVLLPPEI